MGGGAAVGSWLGGKVGGFAEGVFCKAKEVLGNPGGRKGALIGGLAGLALAPFTGGLSIPIGAAIGGLIGNKPCCNHHKPCCHQNMGQYGHNNGCNSQGYGYPPSYGGGGMPGYGGGGYGGGMPGYGGGGYGGGMPGYGGGMPGGGGMNQMMQMQMMMQMMQMMMMMGGGMGGGMGMGMGGGGFGMGNNVNINFGNQGMGMFPPCY